MSIRAGSYAVLMGDIVGSEGAASVVAMHRAFNRAVAGANEQHAAQIKSPLTITLGDEFQGLVRGLENAWRVASYVRLSLMRDGIGCRFVIGVVTLKTPMNTERAWNMMGPGLAAARDKLNDKKSGNAHRFSFPDDPAIELLTDAVGDSLTQIEMGWTERQKAYLLRSRLSGQAPAKIAKSEKVSLRAVYKVLQAAQLDFHDRQSAALSAALAIQDRRYGLI